MYSSCLRSQQIPLRFSAFWVHNLGSLSVPDKGKVFLLLSISLSSCTVGHVQLPVSLDWTDFGSSGSLFLGLLVFGCVVYLLGLAFMASVVLWSFLASPTPTPVGSNNRTFAQAVSNTCNIQQSQLSMPAIKGDALCIKISQAEYEKGFEDCHHNLRGRLF